jgi:hypothetical protein
MKPLVASLVVMLSVPAAWADSDLLPAQRQKLMDVLIEALNQKGTWVSVHAAEALISTGNKQVVLAAFAPQAETATPPFRIGVWRILARCAATPGDRASYLERIRAVMLDPSASDRTHAVEALAKLEAPMTSDRERQAVQEIADGPTNVAPFAAWRVAQSDRQRGVDRLVELLTASDPICRCRAADALARFQPFTDGQRAALERALKKEAADAAPRQFMIEALGGPPLRDLARNSPDTGAVYTAVSQLARTGTREDLALLWKTFERDSIDVRLASAFAILRISEVQQPSH